MDLDTLATIFRLKTETRTGWEDRGITDPESVADHSWGTAVLVQLLSQDRELDTGHCLRLAIIHDLAEAETGDIPRDRQEKGKAAREQEVMDDLFGADHDVTALWQEYENRETPEARFVKQVDKLELALQALIYSEEQGIEDDRLDEFFDTAEQEIDDPELVALLERITDRYRVDR